LAENAAFLLSTRQTLAINGSDSQELTPAAEWLIDNYHLVEVQIREIGVDLPPRYYAQLPKLADGPFAGLPRVFGAMWSLVAHTDSDVEAETLRRYLIAYQEIQTLTIGELWAVPITLRIVLIENLRRVAAIILGNRVSRDMANDLGDRLLGFGGHAPAPWSEVVGSLRPSASPNAFAVQLAHRLRGRDPKGEPALAWLDDQLAQRGLQVESVVHDELREQTAFNATIRNIITSLRTIAALDWSEVFESVCPVDLALSQSGTFLGMDFPTRNLYRTAIEHLARGSRLDEIEIARRAVALAEDAARIHPPADRQCDSGYFLIAGGRRSFEKAIGFRLSPLDRVLRTSRALGLIWYGGCVMILATLFLATPLWILNDAAVTGPWLLLLGCLGIVPASDASVSCVNRFSSWLFGAKPLPELDLRAGIPASLSTLVVMPTLLTSINAVNELVARLEVHYLASPDDALHFALLSDWTDSRTERAAGDEALLAAAAGGIEQLNDRYGPATGSDRFILLHRHRVWNEGEASWMGWERKRGKLHELNRLLRGAKDTTFLPHRRLPKGVRYVVTLDSDTRLPRDAVRRLVGKMAHPLNAPRIDPASSRVVEGYAVLQPRVTPSLPMERNSSVFQRVFSSLDGIDPYAGAVSDVYQDLLGEGSYAGKGIYDIDAFEAALTGRVPESTLLSHDLFEGIFARAGLASDIEVVEAFPVGYAAAAMRQHRWARGDWQLLPWIMPWRGHPGQAALDKLTAIGRWKMLDNLRRTLSAPAFVLALAAGWLLPLGAALGWTGFVLATIVLPALIPLLGVILSRRRWVTLRSHIDVLGIGLRHAAVMTALAVTFMAHQAVLMGDAVLRTLVRLVSRRRLLQWLTAEAGSVQNLSLAGHYRKMAGAPAIGLLVAILMIAAHPWVWLLAAPFAALWMASPAIAWWTSRCSGLRPEPSEADTRALRQLGRRTWRFFESFVTAADNMLPPDNFQEDPAPVLARRTSPTNIGLYVLCAANAHDFGWIGMTDAVDRLEATMATLARMARFRGHFFNWYATEDLRPLEPRYVSTVDSGNLAGHLIALANTCRSWRSLTGIAAGDLAGLADTVGLALEELAKLRAVTGAQPPVTQTLEAALRDLATRIAQAPGQQSSRADRLSELAPFIQAATTLAHDLAVAYRDGSAADAVFWTLAIGQGAASLRRDLDQADGALAPRLADLEHTARGMALGMDFGFLRRQERKLLSIGYLVAEATLDANCYDLLASEARLACFFAIAKGDVPAREWFRLGRTMTPVDDGAALVSWSGSMFEYLMPSLVMRAPSGSLLSRTNRLVVHRQIEFGQSRGIPWGASESAYNVRDLEYTYQYSNFGVPDLGLKSGLNDEFVVAPYATALAAMVDPHEAVTNLDRLAADGARGRYGFYEALDYTPGRVPEGKTVAVVRAFMAHHQGMSIVAIADATLNGIMRTRFHADPLIEATELLLQERAPQSVTNVRVLPAVHKPVVRIRDAASAGGRHFVNANSASPSTHLLCNGPYAVMLTAAGSGYSRWQDSGGQPIAVTRWREDPTLDDWGSYIYLRDVESGRVWSAGAQPSGAAPDAYSVVFNEDHAEFSRRDGTLITKMEVMLSAEEKGEVRRISVTNYGPVARTLDITSYAELALTQPATDMAHPAFAKLFVETEYLADSGALLATRRRRAPDEPEIWAAHLAVADGIPEVETDRARFIGRGRGLRDPAAMDGDEPLSGTVGTVLDAVFSIRRRVTVGPGAVARVAFWTLVASSREEAVASVDRHRDVATFDRAAMMAWTQAQVQLHHLSITPAQADLFQRLAGHLLFAGPALRPASARIRSGSGAQSGLWSQSISGDLPILLLRIDDISDLGVAKQVLLAHEYFRLKRFAVDLVIVNEHPPSYGQELQGALEALIRAQPNIGGGVKPSITLLRADLVPKATLDLLAAAARVVIAGDRGRLSEQLDRAEAETPQRKTPNSSKPRRPLVAALAPTLPLELFNGLGGFAEEGREYVVVLGPGQTTPAPWVNVIANPGFGFQVAAEGSGFTWAGNSRENQLTPWSNDPVSNRTGEAFYIHDMATGVLWCPTAAPVRDPAATYVARHGHGYSRFEHTAQGIATSLLQYVAPEDPVKISRLRLRNLTAASRSISVCAYVEWVLGASRPATAAFVQTEIDGETGALFARNPWSVETGSQIAFMDLGGTQTSWTGDRREVLGRNGSLAMPHAPAEALSGTVGAGLDPCGAMRRVIALPAGGEVELVMVLGGAAGADAARALVLRYRTLDLDGVLSAIRAQWAAILGAVEVKTPDRSMDVMLNGWLLYQTLASRVWARAGFYQASGAYGFRDQLQDGLALCAARPDLVREHLLRAAGRQFVEGDVQHWWLPQSGRGVRTRISDDCAWLAYTVAHYVEATTDTAVLDEPVSFLSGPILSAGEHDRFFLPETDVSVGSLYEHCARALDHSLALGSHGLPLMGTGDWNDGMNRIGEGGRGESVWLGWFLHAALTAFIPLADAREDTARATVWRAHAAALPEALERCWDGEWYLRAYHDDGSPLGSHHDAQCMIDSIAQSWSVISGLAPPGHAARAMASLDRHLVRADDTLLLVLTPPFDQPAVDPGYIAGYPPGIRENGGQYSHAAMWAVLAFTALGDGDKAGALFAMLNPINHARTRAEAERYKVEPYAVVADIYSTAPHVGRGGWSWYTGSAGWMQRVGVEGILGIRIQGKSLHIDPCIPRSWPGFTATIAWRSARYTIVVENPARVVQGVRTIMLDGIALSEGHSVELTDDGGQHAVVVTLGETQAEQAA
jgi:cyclic beta-1,2-glucan synthetase